jgi:hypothetical protein
VKLACTEIGSEVLTDNYSLVATYSQRAGTLP